MSILRTSALAAYILIFRRIYIYICTFHNSYTMHLADTSTDMLSTTTDIASTSGADGSTNPGMLQHIMLI